MTIRLNSNGRPFTREAPSYQDVNDTNDYLETSQIEGDAFVYIDGTTASTTGVTETAIKTYTFNQAIDGLIITGRWDATGSGGDSGKFTFYKNSTQLTVSSDEILIMNGVYDSSNIVRYVQGSTNSLFVFGSASTVYLGVTIFINTSFSATDTFVIKAYGDDSLTTMTSTDRIIRGIKNKSTDTTWVSVS